MHRSKKLNEPQAKENHTKVHHDQMKTSNKKNIFRTILHKEEQREE